MNGLVRALFDDGRCEALVGAMYTSVCVMCNCIALQAVHLVMVWLLHKSQGRLQPVRKIQMYGLIVDPDL